MDHFADIFVNLQVRGKSRDKDRESTFEFFMRVPKLISAEIELLDAKLAPWTQHNSPGKLRADYDGDTFAVKYVS
jgi:hypothetical protein